MADPERHFLHGFPETARVHDFNSVKRQAAVKTIDDALTIVASFLRSISLGLRRPSSYHDDNPGQEMSPGSEFRFWKSKSKPCPKDKSGGIDWCDYIQWTGR